MSEPLIVESPKSLLALLVALVVMFGGAAVAMLAFAVFGDMPMIVRGCVLLIASGAGWMASYGVLLLRYRNHRLEIREEGVRVLADGTTRSLAWSELDYRAQDGLQVVHLYDRAGNRIYAVDYWAHHAGSLLDCLRRHDVERYSPGPRRPRVAQPPHSAARPHRSPGNPTGHHLLGVVSILAGVAILVLVDGDAGVVDESALLAAKGRVAWVEKHKYGVRFGLDGVDRNFSYPSKGGGADSVRDALAGAGDETVRIRYEPDAHGPWGSDVRYHDIWAMSVGDRVVRSYEGTAGGYRDDNAVAPWLGGFFVLGGAVLLMSARLAREADREPRGRGG